jgi:hypothetical protein
MDKSPSTLQRFVFHNLYHGQIPFRLTEICLSYPISWTILFLPYRDLSFIPPIIDKPLSTLQRFVLHNRYHRPIPFHLAKICLSYPQSWTNLFLPYRDLSFIPPIIDKPLSALPRFVFHNRYHRQIPPPCRDLSFKVSRFLFLHIIFA